ncbi:MAG: (d)CMP kinase [Acutalibacteraceae bacterium]|nr:(d)CMP kinase [Clostridia bacterium]MBQ2001400.1 (d)CMP kinase [Clostridia bacterium]MEE1126796.1 (d)CMP kinase [Acutalibacteraceae bacterium]
MISIAIDGPGGAGKSTIAKALAKKLGFIYVDTGALYRAIGLYMINNGVDLKNAAAVTEKLDEVKVELKYVNGEQRVLLCGDDVSEDIRKPEVSMAASDVSAIPAVRDFLLGLQRKMASENNVIMDGRDIGTVVLPNAQIKLFLTASAEERAMRRYKELIEKGKKVEYETVYKELCERDYQDSHREVAPLKPADDSTIIDTTGNDLEKSVQVLMDFILPKLEK